ncbi:hypothetical protein [Plesiomonas shigelloides]|uniref:hypothetical protein n=1 Tax=Plesiomonas shigelloides TaxID=703 RepID=UPI00057AB399|nr:hypothetical protein [Plesiomonas shigelloides]
MTTIQKVPTWQFAVCIFGSLIWLLGLSTAEAIKNLGWEPLYKANAGYFLGYLTAFSGFLFWECVKGRGENFLDSHSSFRWASYITLVAIFITGFFGLIAQIFGDTNWHYNIGSLFGALVIAQGVLPVIENY